MNNTASPMQQPTDISAEYTDDIIESLRAASTDEVRTLLQAVDIAADYEMLKNLQSMAEHFLDMSKKAAEDAKTHPPSSFDYAYLMGYQAGLQFAAVHWQSTTDRARVEVEQRKTAYELTKATRGQRSQ